MDEALPPLIILPPLIPELLTFALCTERWETWACLPGRLTRAAAATALCSWEEDEKEWGTPRTPTDETPWDRWPCELCGKIRDKSALPARDTRTVSPKNKWGRLSNLDGVMMDDVGSSAGLVVVLEGGHSGLLQLLGHQLLCLQ